jgi:adenylate kinase family enzyme
MPARVIAVMGESGAGKTTAMRNLPPDKTYYIDADGKGLSWKGWRKQFCQDNKNYAALNDPIRVQVLMSRLNQDRPNIKYIVVDTLNGIMVADEMRRSSEKGYDKWVDLAQSVWTLIQDSLEFRDDLTVIYLVHSQTDRDDSGYMFTRMKTSGRKLDKIVLESKFTTVLYATVLDGKHVFQVHARNSTAKTPMGAYDETIESVGNDIVEVLKVLEDF